MNASYECQICGKPVNDYNPTFCCAGSDCSCGGRPTEPCVCSKQCDEALFNGIGKPMEERRLDANILSHNFVSPWKTMLLSNGFVEGDMKKDLGDVLPGVLYMVKFNDKMQQCVTLSFYRDEFCQAHYQLFVVARNERIKVSNTADAMQRGNQSVINVLERELTSLEHRVQLDTESLSHIVRSVIAENRSKNKS